MKFSILDFESLRGDAVSHSPALEGLRGFAVIMVFFVHFVGLVRPWVMDDAAVLPLATVMGKIGHGGVDLFFVLSGLLIYGSLIQRQRDYFDFVVRRVRRIYPTFTAVFLIYVGLSIAFPAESKLPATVPAITTYLMTNYLLLPGLFPLQPMITVAWSLSYEFFFYLVLPTIIAGVSLRNRTPRWRVSFFCLVAVSGVLYCATNGGHIRLIMFLAGILLYEILEHFSDTLTPSCGTGSAALLVGMASTLAPATSHASYAVQMSLLFVCLLVFCLACLRNTTGWLARGFSWTPVRWLGNMSYSYYLFHGLTLKAGFLVVAMLIPAKVLGSWAFSFLLAGMFALTLMTSAVLYLLVERPFSITRQYRRASRDSVTIS